MACPRYVTRGLRARVPELRSRSYREPESAWHEAKVIVPPLRCTKKKAAEPSGCNTEFSRQGTRNLRGGGGWEEESGCADGGDGGEWQKMGRKMKNTKLHFANPR